MKRLSSDRRHTHSARAPHALQVARAVAPDHPAEADEAVTQTNARARLRQAHSADERALCEDAAEALAQLGPEGRADVMRWAQWLCGPINRDSDPRPRSRTDQQPSDE